MQINKNTALSAIYECAELYRLYFLGFSYLFVYMANDSVIDMLEAVFSSSNFRHLTGVTTNKDVSANEFWQKAVDNRLRVSDFELEEKHMPDKKLSALPEFLSKLPSSVKMIGEYDKNAKIQLDTKHIAGGVKSCMGFTRNYNNLLVPNTFLKEDIRPCVTKAKPVLAIWRKKRNVTSYSEEVSEEVWVNHKKITEKNLTHQYNLLKLDKFKQDIPK